MDTAARSLVFTRGKWLNSPTDATVTEDECSLRTVSGTDFWQGTYYGFRIANAPALLFDLSDNFTLDIRTRFSYQSQFDQCGVLVYIDDDNWFKASIEHEPGTRHRLGSVVTNNAHSDWATTDIAPVECMHYQLSRRGPDFRIDWSPDGIHFHQMRIFHLHTLGRTSTAMGKADPPEPAAQAVRVGCYACSPGESSFLAQFDQGAVSACRWLAHQAG